MQKKYQQVQLNARLLLKTITQPTFTYSKSTVETLEKGVKYAQS